MTNGKEFYHYDLVCPEEVELDNLPLTIKKWFNKRRVIPLKVSFIDGNLKIKERVVQGTGFILSTFPEE